MESRVASIRNGGGLDRLHGTVQLLEDEWRRGGDVRLDHFWARQRSLCEEGSVDAGDLLAELIKADMRCRFERGQSPTVADYMDQFPGLRDADSRVVSLVYEEFCLHEERGRAPDVDAFCDRYAPWKSSLIAQLNYHRFISQAAGGRPAPPRFPEPGAQFAEFQLLSVLGTGGSSRVFLASDLSLGGKQIVLKVTVDRGQEPQVQGRLDHPHIVPVNSVVYPDDSPLCALSMPYRRGLPLDEVIKRVDPLSKPRKALALWEAIVPQADTSASMALRPADGSSSDSKLYIAPRGDGWEGFPVDGTYAQGVAWIIMIVARALQYAHELKTYHRDVKPGNLLLTLKHGPQLLDFNLAASPHSVSHAQAAHHGGTLPYMAPEQIEAFLNPDLWDQVGAQADVYSLGLVFRELLTGQKPDLPDPKLPTPHALRAVLNRRPSLSAHVREFNPAIPHALEAIVAKCLAFSRQDRYPGAEALEEDLKRFLEHRPLTVAANRSRRERAANWLTRHRRSLSAVLLGVVLSAAMYATWKVAPRLWSGKARPESKPAFIAAVNEFGHGHLGAAAEGFESLNRAYPDSSLVKFYLAFAINDEDNPKKKARADTLLSLALAAPDAETELTSWARKGHSEVVERLVNFAQAKIESGDRDGDKFDYRNPFATDEDRDRVVRWPKYELAHKAIRIAALIDPTPVPTRYFMAKTERFFGEYEAAFERLSALIVSLETNRDRTSDIWLYRARTLRVWVAFLWGDRDLENKTVSRSTLEHLGLAETDIKICEHYLLNYRCNDPLDQIRSEYHSLHDKARTLLTRTEVELELARTAEARQSLRRAEIALRRLNECITAYKLTWTVPPTDELTDRVKQARNRLRQAGLNDLGMNAPAGQSADSQTIPCGSPPGIEAT